MLHGTKPRTARLLAFPAVFGMLLGLLSPGPASAETAVTSFNILGRGALMHFFLSVPEAFLPFTVDGGAFESYGKIESLPHSFGYAGAAPVPLATSLGIALPEQIPENVREGIRSLDLKALPNYCQADFPESREDGGESYCGGPAQPQKSLGLTGALMNGHVKATGDFDEAEKTSILSESRVAELAVPGIQSKVFGGATTFRSFINDQGIPVAEASARIQSLSVLGSLVRFEQIESFANVINDGTEGGSAGKVSLTIAAATVAGIPVQVTSDGVIVSEPVKGLSPKQATDAVNKALAGAGGATIKILPGSGIERDGNRLVAQSPSLVIEYNSQTPTPAHVIEQYGLAEINALAAGNRRAQLALSGGESTTESTASNGAGGSPQQGASASTGTDTTSDVPVVNEDATAATTSSPAETSGGVATPADAALSESAPSTAVSEPSVEPEPGAVNVTNSIGDQALLAQNAGANPSLMRPSPWVRAGYLLLVGLVVLAIAANAALRPRARAVLRRSRSA